MELTFDNPAAFWLLLCIPVLIVLKVLGDARARTSVSRLASPRLLDGLLYSTGRSRSWVVLSLELLALAFFAAALARPQYGTVSEESKGSGRSLIIAMDTSRSMLAIDLKPNRLERAQMAAEDLVKRLRNDRIGLMPFAGTAFMYAPITPDTDAIIESIQSIDTEIIPTGGSNISRAIDLGIATFKKADLSGQQAMVIFSDGEELEGEALAAARRARDAKLAIICVGVGTPQGEVIPDPDPTRPGQFLRDRNNKPIFTRLKKEVLTQIAALTGGLYLSLDGAGISDSRIDLILSKLQRSAMKSKTIETAVDRYRWPLCAGLISLTAAFITGIVRRHRVAVPATATGTAALAALVCVLFAGPPAARAQSDLLPPVTEAKPAVKAGEARAVEKPEPANLTGDPWKFYKEGDWRNSVFNFSRVAAKAPDDELDRLQMARGVAAYKAALANSEKFDSGMMEQSMDAFGVALSSDDLNVRAKAHYNLANAVFERAKAAEKERVINLSKAKSKKKAKAFQITLKYLDTVIRQCENSVEHYQETLILAPDNKDAKKNHEEVVKFIEKLRDIRQQKASEQQGKGKGEGEGESEGEGEGEGDQEGSGKSKGKGKGQGDGEGEGEGEGDDEGDGKKDGPDPGAGSGDKANEEFKGKAGADGDTDADGGDKGEGEKEEGEGGKDGQGEGEGEEGEGKEGSSEIGQSNSLRTLKNLSQELKTKPRNQTARERAPSKDW